ncbi:MAG: hypothetical protein ABJL99_13665 [Aliishimia sp.]
MTVTWVFVLLIFAGVCSLGVRFRGFSLWADVVRALDAMPEPFRTASKWPDMPGKATIDKRLQNRVVYFGAPPGASEEAKLAAGKYRKLNISLYAGWFVVFAVFVGWPVLILAVLLAISALIASPWPRVS